MNIICEKTYFPVIYTCRGLTPFFYIKEQDKNHPLSWLWVFMGIGYGNVSSAVSNKPRFQM